MIDITHISYSNDNNGLSKYNHEPLASARHIICSEIENTKMRNDFYRYLSWRIQTAPLKKKIMHRYKNFYVTCFTNESWVMIESFVGYAVEVFNNSHNKCSEIIHRLNNKDTGRMVGL